MPIFAFALYVVFATPLPVSAHAVAIRSDPPGACLPAVTGSRCPPTDVPTVDPVGPPSAVRVWFSEPVRPFGQGLTIVGPRGRRVDRGQTRVAGDEMSVDVDATESGLYVVHWQVIGGDTHPGLGQFAFRLGQNGGVVAATDESTVVEEVAPLGLALQAGSRWLHFLGYALSFGVLAFQILVLPATPSTATVNQRIRNLVGLGLLLLLLAEPLALLGQTASLGPGQLVDPAAVSAAFDSSFGRILSLRLGALFLLWVLLGIASAGRRLTTLALGAALAVVDGASAHALSVQPPWLGLAVNAVHLSAAGVWLGGIAALVALWVVKYNRFSTI